MNLRPYSDRDIDSVLALNLASEAKLSPLDADRLNLLIDMAELAVVAEVNDQVVAFMLVFAEGSSYDSENYRWFNERYASFLYVDRIIVDESARGQGLASGFYQWLLDEAKQREKSDLVAEIDIEPRNEASLQFHQRFGFSEVGQQIYGAGKRVSLQCRSV